MAFERGIVGHAYPWDVIGDPGFGRRSRDRGIGEVALAAAYHAVRAATPVHPVHRIVDMPAALHLGEGEASGPSREIVPPATTELYREAAAGLAADSLGVTPWSVLTHHDGMGALHPDHVVRNAFGDLYGYALCPSSPAVRDYVLGLVAVTARATTSGRAVLESLDALGAGHAGAHDKLGGAGWGPGDEELLSVCFCAHCRAGYAAAGEDPDGIAHRVRATVGTDRPRDEALGAVGDVVAAHRAAVLDGLVRDVRDIADAAGVDIAILADGGHPFAGAPADSPVRGFEEIVPCWDGIEPSAARVREAVSRSERVAVYVSVLDGSSWRSLSDRLAALSDAGATRVHVYHLGLASASAADAFDRAWEAIR